MLLRELDVVDAARKQVHEGRGAVTIAEVDAAAGREALRQEMLAFAGKREAELGELAAQQGTTRTRAELAASIASLATLARRWIARTGSDAVLAEDVGLVESVVQTAVKHRETLIGHGTESALDGSKTGHDTPLVNLAEGRVLVEMEAAMRAFDNEGPRNPSVPRLNPGPATRRALGRAASPSRGASDDGTKDSSKEPKTPPANNPATATTTRSTTVRKSTKTRSKR